MSEEERNTQQFIGFVPVLNSSKKSNFWNDVRNFKNCLAAKGCEDHVLQVLVPPVELELPANASHVQLLRQQDSKKEVKDFYLKRNLAFKYVCDFAGNDYGGVITEEMQVNKDAKGAYEAVLKEANIIQSDVNRILIVAAFNKLKCVIGVDDALKEC